MDKPHLINKIVAVVLAAGASSRMGEHKLLKPLGGQSIVRRVVERVSRASFDQVLVVLGRDAEGVRAELDGLKCNFAYNPHYAQAMGTSLRAAVEAFPENVEAAMFILADQPFVSTQMYEKLLEAYRKTTPLVVISQYGEVKAPPHIFRRELFAELGLPGTEGAKEVVKAHQGQAVVVELPDIGLTDIDEPTDYQRAVELAAQGY